MLRKIDCIMIQVADVAAATTFYTDVFRLQPQWWDEHSTGLGFPETDAEIVLHDFPDMPSSAEVHYLVDDVEDVVRILADRGCQICVAPFAIAIGKCAVIVDPFGCRLCLLDMSKGPRQPGQQKG